MTNNIECLDLNSGLWSLCGRLTFSRNKPHAICLGIDHALIIGGTSEDNKIIEEFEILNTWTK